MKIKFSVWCFSPECSIQVLLTIYLLKLSPLLRLEFINEWNSSESIAVLVDISLCSWWRSKNHGESDFTPFCWNSFLVSHQCSVFSVVDVTSRRYPGWAKLLENRWIGAVFGCLSSLEWELKAVFSSICLRVVWWTAAIHPQQEMMTVNRPKHLYTMVGTQPLQHMRPLGNG
jgi:hypothetical protein